MPASHRYASGLCLLLLAGCSAPHPPDEQHEAPRAAASTPAQDAREGRRADFRAPELGLSLQTPAGMQLRRDFTRSYLDNGAWKTYAAPDSRGEPVAALVVDGSNRLLAAELRVGASDDATSVRQCTDLPGSAMADSHSQVTLDGVPFQHFRAGDGAMSHFMQVESYRAVRAGHCLAIDLLLIGTNPSVYPTPPALPFTREQAWSKLHEALAAVRFSH